MWIDRTPAQGVVSCIDKREDFKVEGQAPDIAYSHATSSRNPRLSLIDADRRLVDADAVTARALRAVHGGIGTFEQRIDPLIAGC